MNFEKQFDEQVIANFVHEYANGRTPLPCAHCNSDLKFATLAERAAGFGADAVATGHYARVERDEDGRHVLKRGLDAVEGSGVFPLLADAGPAVARDVPGRRSLQGGGARLRARARTCRSLTSRTARRSASFPTTTTPRSWRARIRRVRRAGAIVDETGQRPRRPRGAASLHRRSAEGTGPVALAHRRTAVRHRAEARRPSGRRRPEGVRSSGRR